MNIGSGEMCPVYTARRLLGWCVGLGGFVSKRITVFFTSEITVIMHSHYNSNDKEYTRPYRVRPHSWKHRTPPRVWGAPTQTTKSTRRPPLPLYQQPRAAEQSGKLNSGGRRSAAAGGGSGKKIPASSKLNRGGNYFKVSRKQRPLNKSAAATISNKIRSRVYRICKASTED